MWSFAVSEVGNDLERARGACLMVSVLWKVNDDEGRRTEAGDKGSFEPIQVKSEIQLQGFKYSN